MPIDVSALTSALREAADRHSVPGVQVGLLSGSEHQVVSTGVLTAGSGEPVIDTTRFHAGSLAKALTGQWVLEAAADGLIDLDLPCAEQTAISWDDTPRSLLTQTSGRPNEMPAADEELDAFVARVGGMPRLHAPGRFSYCNAGWSVLDLLLQERTGAGFAERLAGAGGSFGIPNGAAAGHVPREDGSVSRVPPTHADAAAAAGACWWASADELLHVAERHLHPEAHGLDPMVIAQLRDPAASLPGASVFDAWGHGWASWHRGDHEAFGWAGFTSGHRAFLRAFPRHSAAIVVLTNCAGGFFGGPGGAALFDDLLPALLELVGVPGLPDPATHQPRWASASLAGRYGPAAVTAVAPDSVRLSAQAFGGGDLVLDRVWGDTFDVRGRPPGAIPIAFDADPAGAGPDWLYIGPFAVPKVG